MLEELLALRSEFDCLTIIPLRSRKTIPNSISNDAQLGPTFLFRQPGILKCLLCHPLDPYLAASKLPTSADTNFLLTNIAGKQIDLILASREGTLNLARKIKKAHPEARIILRSHNDEVKYHWTAARSERRFTVRGRLVLDAIRLRWKQRSLLAIPDATGVISPNDLTSYRKHQDHVIYVPPVLLRHSNTTAPTPLDERDSRVVFVGALDNAQSVMGLKWFVQEVWPRTLEHVPNATLDVIGRAPSSELINFLSNNPSVRCAGEVDDLSPYLDIARIVINPSLTGSGVNIKIGTALAYSLPIVTTSSGARGVAGLGEAGLIAKSAPEFAEIVTLLLTDDETWTRARDQIRAIGRSFTAETFTGRISSLLRELN